MKEVKIKQIVLQRTTIVYTNLEVKHFLIQVKPVTKIRTCTELCGTRAIPLSIESNKVNLLKVPPTSQINKQCQIMPFSNGNFRSEINKSEMAMRDQKLIN